eukprot:m.25965 g.25965  ORF g.25965 m.25965 type:complete len:131 (-) comp11450_c0_seq1:42-434(-)
MAGRKVLSKLRNLTRAWPLDTSRAKRDLGEHLQTVYTPKVFHYSDRALAPSSVPIIEAEVAALSDLSHNKFKRMFERKADTTFTGSVGSSWGFSQLSSEQQQKFGKGSFFERMAKNANSKQNSSQKKESV